MNAEIEFLLRDALARRGIVLKKSPWQNRADPAAPTIERPNVRRTWSDAGSRASVRATRGRARETRLTASISSHTTECGIG